MSWTQKGYLWAFKSLETGNLVGSQYGGPILNKTRKLARAIAKLNRFKPGEIEIIKVRISFAQIS